MENLDAGDGSDNSDHEDSKYDATKNGNGSPVASSAPLKFDSESITLHPTYILD